MTSQPLAGEVDLVVPPDLFDLMAPVDPDEARVVFYDLFGRMFPRMGVEDRGFMADGILLWRERLLASGLIMHGLVAIPANEEIRTPAHWHIMAGVVEVPVAGELDAGAVAARFFGQKLNPESSYTESFDTEMGWGVGLITQTAVSPVTPPPGMEGTPATALPPFLGMAAALAAPRGGNRGLLVLGICLDVERTLEMASIVAAIAGNSTMRLDETATPAEEAHVVQTS